MSKRYKVFRLAGSDVERYIEATLNGWPLKLRGLPDDAKVVQVMLDTYYDDIVVDVRVESESFPPLKPFDATPEMHVRLEIID